MGPSSAGLFCRLHLRVNCATEHGQAIHVSGSSLLAGQADPSAALEMVTTPEEYPMWRTRKPVIVPRDAPHTYAYAIFQGGKFKRWESLDKPRVVLCSTPSTVVEDVFDDPRTPSRRHRKEAFGPLGDMGTSLPQEEDSLEERMRQVSEATVNRANVRPPSNARLFLVCFHLPITLSRGSDGKYCAEWNESLIAKGEKSVADKISTRWVGTVGTSDNQEFSAEEQEEIRALLQPMNCTPIFVSTDILQGSYLGFCKQIMWPTFHNIDVLDLATCSWNAPENDPDGAESPGGAVPPPTSDPSLAWDKKANSGNWWEAYRTLNSMFAAHMQEVLEEDDVMWVHDYHLMLLPKMISDGEKERLGGRRTPIIFFMHIPFPTSQIFRALAQGEVLLEGMLSASVVGFHAFDHARHFLNAGKRLLGLSYQSIKGGLIGVEYDGRTVMVVMSHVGVEPDQMNKALSMPSTKAIAQSLESKHPGRTIICAVDVCQKLSGISLKLLAFERLLAEYPVWRDKVVLVQRCLRPGSRTLDEAHTSAEVAQLAQRIKVTYGDAVLDLLEVGGNNLDLPSRLALFRCSDVLINSAIREGLNLVPLEYIFTRRDPDMPGVVLASEFSACSSLLNGAIRINPFDVQRTAAALDQALTMDEAERTGRRARDLPYISSRPSAEWTYQVLMDMWAMGQEARVTHMEESGMGSELTHEMSMTGFKALPVDRVLATYRSSRRRVLLLDYGGTLLEKEGLHKYLKSETMSVTGRSLSPRMKDSIRALCADPCNTVFIISGLHARGLEQSLGDIPRLGLASNNGLEFSWPEEATKENRHWNVFDYGVNWEEIKAIALPLLNKFTAHTNGSSIKLRDTGIAWSYYSTDPEWGQMQAKQLSMELELALSAYAVKIQHVRGQVEVVPALLHKGVVAKTILREMLKKTGHYPDFVLCIGDDVSDEHLFSSVYSFLADMDDVLVAKPELRTEGDNLRVFISTVGKKPSRAAFYLGDTNEVGDLVSGFTHLSPST